MAEEWEGGRALMGLIDRRDDRALNVWVSRFIGIVVPALKNRPDLLIKMGLKPRG